MGPGATSSHSSPLGSPSWQQGTRPTSAPVPSMGIGSPPPASGSGSTAARIRRRCSTTASGRACSASHSCGRSPRWPTGGWMPGRWWCGKRRASTTSSSPPSPLRISGSSLPRPLGFPYAWPTAHPMGRLRTSRLPTPLGGCVPRQLPPLIAATISVTTSWSICLADWPSQRWPSCERNWASRRSAASTGAGAGTPCFMPLACTATAPPSCPPLLTGRTTGGSQGTGSCRRSPTLHQRG
mmetsp:Transcript_132427/g.229699  ORF Transcript_132427/g.229699 Transcript_132427/m.229699 type:complete len:239 (-) Transcript_132427:1076-1792(-)